MGAAPLITEMADEINTLVNNVSYSPGNVCESSGKIRRRKDFYAPNVTQTARKTNMTFPEDVMIRGLCRERLI